MCDLIDRLEQRGMEKGLIEGRAEGRAEGFAEGKQKILDLFNWLTSTGRSDDIAKAVENETFLNSLYEEFERTKA